jgi:hypothetical protein
VRGGVGVEEPMAKSLRHVKNFHEGVRGCSLPMESQRYTGKVRR